MINSCDEKMETIASKTKEKLGSDKLTIQKQLVTKYLNKEKNNGKGLMQIIFNFFKSADRAIQPVEPQDTPGVTPVGSTLGPSHK